MVLVCENIVKKYDNNTILQGVSFCIEQGEIISITGKSGSGKSTLLKILATLDSNFLGKVLIDNTDIKNLTGKSLAEFRNKKIGIVFQEYNLLSEFTTFENICIPGYISKDKKTVDSLAENLLHDLQIEDCKDKLPHQISGGQAQRAAIARALINSPNLIFADEPTGNLDFESAKNIHNIILSLREKYGKTFVIVTHNSDLVNITDKTIQIK